MSKTSRSNEHPPDCVHRAQFQARRRQNTPYKHLSPNAVQALPTLPMWGYFLTVDRGLWLARNCQQLNACQPVPAPAGGVYHRQLARRLRTSDLGLWTAECKLLIAKPSRTQSHQIAARQFTSPKSKTSRLASDLRLLHSSFNLLPSVSSHLIPPNPTTKIIQSSNLRHPASGFRPPTSALRLHARGCAAS